MSLSHMKTRSQSLVSNNIFAHSMLQSKDFKVAIVGGGMCGLACAVGLRRAGIPVDIFESTVGVSSELFVSF